MTETREPTLSIVVPTKNCYSTLNVIVDQFSSWQSDKCQLEMKYNGDISTFGSFLQRHLQILIGACINALD